MIWTIIVELTKSIDIVRQLDTTIYKKYRKIAWGVCIDRVGHFEFPHRKKLNKILVEALGKEDRNNKFFHFNILKHRSLSKSPIGELIDLQTQVKNMKQNKEASYNCNYFKTLTNIE